MTRYIKELTEEQKLYFPEWVEKWIKIGLQTGETDWDTFDKYMPICYEKAGLQYPKTTVRVDSPLVGALAASISRSVLSYINKYLNTVSSAVGPAIDSAVGSAVDSEVDSEVDSAIRSAVGLAVDSAVNSAVGSAVDSAVDPAVSSAVGSAVRSAVHSAVRSVVNSAVSSAVDSEVYSAVDSAVDSAVGSAVDSGFFWHNWLGGQFWCGGWWGSPTYVSFFTDICNLKLDPDIQERATAYRKVCESVNYIWPNSKFIIVCARPKHIYRNTQGQLHYEHGKAIEYPDGWGLYFLNGIQFPEDLYLEVISRNMLMKDILQIENIDQRIQAMKFCKTGIRDFYRSEKGICIDTEIKVSSKNHIITYELWKIPPGEVFSKEVYFAVYSCPSSQERGDIHEYTKGVPIFNKIADAMAWGMSNEKQFITGSQWRDLVPLIHES